MIQKERQLVDERNRDEVHVEERVEKKTGRKTRTKKPIEV